MGFSVSYRSTNPLSPAQIAAIQYATDQLNEGRSWLSCEPPHFYENSEPGCLKGGSKPAFELDPIEIAQVEQEGLPDGTLADLIEILCVLSRDHGVDWEIGHDFGFIGNIVDGDADAAVGQFVEALAGIFDDIVDFNLGNMRHADDDEEPPDILPFPGVN